MRTHLQRVLVLAAALLGCIAARRATQFETMAERDNAEIRSFVPTDAALHAYFAATRALQSEVSRDALVSKDCGEMNRAQSDEGLTTLRRSLTAHPRCYAFFRRRGLEERETGIWMTLVFWMSQYAMQPDQVAPLEVLSEPQARFAQRHRAEFDAFMRQFAGRSDTDQDD